MLRMIALIADGLLNRVVPSGIARAETCTRGPVYCDSPSSKCSCYGCEMQCFHCPGGLVCKATGRCC